MLPDLPLDPSATTSALPMEKIVTLSPVPTLVADTDLHLTCFSASCRVLVRHSLDDSLGRAVLDLFEKLFPAPSLTLIRTAIDEAIVSRDVRLTANLLTHTDAYWSVRVLPIVDADQLLHVMFELRDVTIEHASGQALDEERYENETYRILVDTVKDYAIFLLDTHGNVATWNAGAALLKGYTRKEIVGRHFSTFYGDEDKLAGKPSYELETCLREGKVEDEGWRYRKDGTRFWANVVITAVYRADVHIGYSKVTRDLTERREAEARLMSAYEESAELKSKFLANMSHEIRTPMHGMLSAAILLNDTPLTPEQRELAGIMQESGHTLLQVINDILDYSKLASGSFVISSDPFDIDTVIASITSSFQTALKPGVQLTYSTEPGMAQNALGDKPRYRQILQNLVGNSIKFTDEGRIHTHASMVSEDAEFYTVLTEVLDTGIGVAPYAIKSLFTPFTQFDASYTKKYQGTGLGLSICKSLAELMGGTIGFKPNPHERGSVFWFTIKLPKAEKRAENNIEVPEEISDKVEVLTLQEPKKPTVGQLEALAPLKRILMAEDNPINQKVLLKV